MVQDDESVTLAGTVAAVTGAGRGIGREVACELARRGARVAVLAQTSSQIAETAALIRAEGGEALAVPVDWRNATKWRAHSPTSFQTWGRLISSSTIMVLNVTEI